MSSAAMGDPAVRPIGLLGGTFDPIHYGHLRLAEEARSRLLLDRVCLVPAGQPAHRQPPLATASHRLAMARLAVESNSALEVVALEADSPQPSYTVPTLERLRERFGARQSLVLLLGADAFLGLPSWHRWQDLFSLAHVAVATRPGHDLHPTALPPLLATELAGRAAQGPDALADAPAGCILPFPITALDISATAIRRTLATGGSVRYLLPDGALDYIEHNHLYSVY